jgi:hypothetical protein
VLCLNSFRAAALANLLLFILHLGNQIDHPAGILLEFGRFSIDAIFQDGSSHAVLAAVTNASVYVTKLRLTKRSVRLAEGTGMTLTRWSLARSTHAATFLVFLGL